MGDGTRTSRMIEKAQHPVTNRPFLVGASFPADVRKWPDSVQGGPGMHPLAQDIEKVHEYISRVRDVGDLSAEVHTEAFTCVSDRSRGLLICVLFPEPSKGFCSIHHLLYWARLAHMWYDHSIRCMGYATDSCSTGLGAGTALMTPTVTDVAAKHLFLGLPDRDFIYCARWVGARKMADGKTFNYFLKWYADAPHLARTARRNLTYDARSLLYVSYSNGGQECAVMEALEELQKIMPRREGAFLTEIFKINEWRDQKGDAAYAMLRASTVDMLLEHRPAMGRATALYLTSYNYVLEPWVNPDMTNPMAITFNSWYGYGLARLNEIYITKVLKLDKDLYLPSYQLVRTTAAMAHTAVTHCQHVFLDFGHRCS